MSHGKKGKRYIKHNTDTTKARIDEIKYKIDVNTLERQNIEQFVLIDPITHNTSAVGMIIDKSGSEKLRSRITDMDRAKHKKHFS